MFLSRHHSSGGAGFSHAVIVHWLQLILATYLWFVSAICRHRAVHSSNGNSTLPAWLPASLRKKGVSKHEANRALLCVSCDNYLGRRQWAGNIPAIYLGDSADTLRQVKQQFPDYDFACVTAATSLCSTCRRNIKRGSLDRRETATRVAATFGRGQRIPPCEQQPVHICRICQRVAAALSSPPRKKKRARSAVTPPDDAGFPNPKRVGRPRDGLWCTRFPAGRPFSPAAPGARSPAVAPEVPPRRYSAEQFLRIGDAISSATSSATSTRALQRVGGAMQQQDMPAKPPAYLHQLLRGRNSFLDDDFVTVTLKSAALPLCHLRTSDSDGMEGRRGASVRALLAPRCRRAQSRPPRLQVPRRQRHSAGGGRWCASASTAAA